MHLFRAAMFTQFDEITFGQAALVTLSVNIKFVELGSYPYVDRAIMQQSGKLL